MGGYYDSEYFDKKFITYGLTFFRRHKHFLGSEESNFETTAKHIDLFAPFQEKQANSYTAKREKSFRPHAEYRGMHLE